MEQGQILNILNNILLPLYQKYPMLPRIHPEILRTVKRIEQLKEFFQHGMGMWEREILTFTISKSHNF